MTDNERKETISALRQILAMCDFVDQYGDSIDEEPYFDAVETAIESLNETGWIPVSERLPSESGRYLVTYPLFTRKDKWLNIMNFGKPSMPNIKVKGKCWYMSDDEYGDVVYDDILAWMPLPKPYKGGDDE